jgi:hypothetical protein
MTRLRFYQFSLRRMFWLTAVAAGGLWLALWWVGRIAPERGETLVTSREQLILQAMGAELGLNYCDSSGMPMILM